jgi:4-hydroxybenzoyl-CoA reductase subunit beta
MLPLPEFDWAEARSIEEAVELLSGPPGEAMILAGGTDIVPNLKHGLFSPKRLVSLRRVEALRDSRETDGGSYFFGAGITLAELITHPVARTRYPALARAASLVAGPQLRHMGTLGGNLCLDTRCVYYNQTHFWRNALGYCLKKDGDECFVVPGGSRCVAAHSADTPGPLIAYGAEVSLVSVRGERRMPVADFFRADGIRNTVREPDELVTGVTLPAPQTGLHAAYEKLRTREAIDFPALSVAVSAVIGKKKRLVSLTLVVSGLGARPRVVRRADELVADLTLDDELVEKVGRLAYDQCRPLTSINVDPDWRRDVLPVYVRRALGRLEPSVVKNQSA